MGRLGLTSPSFIGTMLGYDCHLPVSVAFTRRSPTDTLFVPYVRVLSSSSLALRNACPNAWPAWSPGTPLPGCSQGSKWLSQVPRITLWTHALLFDPGGDPSTCLSALRSAAFRSNDGVGFPAFIPAFILGDFSPVHDYTNFGAQSHGLFSCSRWLRTPVTGLTRSVRYRPVG